MIGLVLRLLGNVANSSCLTGSIPCLGQNNIMVFISDLQSVYGSTQTHISFRFSVSFLSEVPEEPRIIAILLHNGLSVGLLQYYNFVYATLLANYLRLIVFGKRILYLVTLLGNCKMLRYTFIQSIL